MALSRSDAIYLFINLGKQFISHYRKVIDDINSSNKSLNHHVSEMQAWWNSVKNIKLKTTKKSPTDEEFKDWFFSAGGNIEDYLPEDLIETYSKFVEAVLNNRDVNLITILEEIYK